MKTLHLKTRKAKVIAAVVAVVMLASGAFLFIRVQQARAPQVQLTTAARDRITNSVVAVADIQARDRSTITLVPAVKVVDVLVQKGQRVSAGDTLVTLDTSDVQNQLAQQRIALSDAQSTLGYLAGPNATANNATGKNAVGQAQVALDSARAAEAAARQRLADAPGLGNTAVRQAEIALEGAQLTADTAQANLEAAGALDDNAVQQAQIALENYENAVRDLAALEDQLRTGVITQALYDAQSPALRYLRDSAENSRRSAQIALDTAQLSAEASSRAAEKQAADAALAVTNAEAALDAARLQSDAQLRAAQQAVGDAQRAVRTAEIALSNARSGASSGRAGDSERISNQRSQIALIEANIRYLQDKVADGRIRATVDGVVSRMDAVENQYPQLGDSIVVEGGVGYVASLDVPQADSVGIRPGQRATVTLKGTGATFKGSVTTVAPVAERPATSADRNPKVNVEATILDPDDTVRVGFEADVEVFLDDKSDALQISLEAVRSEPGSGRKYVWVVDDRNRVSRVFIVPGIESGDRVEVLSGLAEGEDCVVDPPDSLVEGAKVRVAGGGR